MVFVSLAITKGDHSRPRARPNATRPARFIDAGVHRSVERVPAAQREQALIELLQARSIDHADVPHRNIPSIPGVSAI